MAYFSEAALAALGFRRVGANVKISDKASIYNPELIEIGDQSRIDDFCVVSGKVTLGRNVHLAVHCNVAGGEPGVTLEDFSGLSYGCHVFSQSSDYYGRTLVSPTVPDKFKRETKSPVLIRRHSIVGACSVILPGITLAEGTAVGAMSLVTKSTEPWTLYFGVPAKRRKARSRELLELERIYLREEAESQDASTG